MTWKAERNYLGLVLLSCLVIGAIFVWLMPGCASQQNPACSEDRLAAIVAQCVAAEVERGCDSDPVNLCPELIVACEERIKTWEHCQ